MKTESPPVIAGVSKPPLASGEKGVNQSRAKHSTILPGLSRCPRCGKPVCRDADGVACLSCGWVTYDDGYSPSHLTGWQPTCRHCGRPFMRREHDSRRLYCDRVSCQHERRNRAAQRFEATHPGRHRKGLT